MPVTAAGWRMEPPVSVPMASGASKPATAANDPPDEPPGIRPRSQGLRVGPYAEFSVELPIANSSMLVLPSMTTPASLIRRVIVASYGGRHPSRIFDPAVVGRSFVTTTSFMASGTPAHGPRTAPDARAASTALAAAPAPPGSTCREALISGSTSVIRSRCACATSTAATSPPAMRAASSAAVMRVRSLIEGPRLPGSSRERSSRFLREDPRDPELVVLDVGGAGEDGVARQRRLDLVDPVDVGHRHGVGGRRDVSRSHLPDPGDRTEDDVELLGEDVQLLVGHGQPGEPGQVRHVGAADPAGRRVGRGIGGADGDVTVGSCGCVGHGSGVYGERDPSGSRIP